MASRIYVLTHKKFIPPVDQMYVPLQVGKAGKEDLGFLGDDTGESISKLNPFYSELTGLYWVWKNCKDVDYAGVCHYRRYLINEKNKLFTESEIEGILAEYDFMTTKELELNFSYSYGFGVNHKPEYLTLTETVIGELYPEYLPDYQKLVQECHTYFGNIMITSKEKLDQYCQWLFAIFSEVKKRTRIEEEDEYHRRIFGFISEFLLYVYLKHNNYRVLECKVGMVGEKAETRELKQALGNFLEQKNWQSAKQYFIAFWEKRPDVCMEASDITGELKTTMQIISTAERESAAGGVNILEKKDWKYKELVLFFTHLNQAVVFLGEKQDEAEKVRERYSEALWLLQSDLISKEMLFVSVSMFFAPEKVNEKMTYILSKILL